jgi:hypothetical protein
LSLCRLPDISVIGDEARITVEAIAN